MRAPVIGVAAALAAVALSGCSSTSKPADAPPKSIRVYAAASLQQVFTEIGGQFEKDRGIHPEFTFAGSSDLVTQLSNGAPGDVLATADEKTMKQAADGRLVAGDSMVFASNTLVIAVAEGNPKGVTGLSDLAHVSFVRCAPQVPCGAATDKVLKAGGIAPRAVSEENSVTDVLGKVGSGQADAGLVYATDVARAGGKVQAVTFPEAAGVVNRYPIATLKAATDTGAAKEFTNYVVGPGRSALERAGFGAP